MTMTEAELKRYGERLRALRIQLGGEIAELEDEAFRPLGGQSSGNLSDLPLHPADVASDVQEEDMTLDLIANQGRTLAEVDAALERVKQGTFGACEGCGQQIRRERLDAIPYTRYCIRCAQESEASSAG
jgi:RNA polymerase-binding transcription factor DksA